jgi:hypothetical protein
MFDIETFYQGLVEHGLIIPTGIRGGYGRGAVFERVLRGFNELVSRTGAPDGAEEMSFPPIVARALIEKVGYMNSFPQLAGWRALGRPARHHRSHAHPRSLLPRLPGVQRPAARRRAPRDGAQLGLPPRAL